jgi:ornithine cyclodeaminase/alanine dehydrogenase-like protein (mu-crystallin family)
VKWVTGFPANIDAGAAAIHATVILSDARTGAPRAIMDAGLITAHRTAAVSGVSIGRWGPPIERPARVALIGAGVQARGHLPVIAHVSPGARVVLVDRDEVKARALAEDATAGREGLSRLGLASIEVAAEVGEALAGADLVITVVSFGPDRQAIPLEAFAPRSTIVAVDYDMCVPAALAASADLFLTDDRGQFLANRSAMVFRGYPEPSLTIGEAILAATPRPAGRVLISHLGVGLADVVFADAILRRAESLGLGTLLEP